ncbi:MAG: helix-turn-helix domain-containing protein [Desulfurivibrio sp.]|nr:helix-turn-helix domain-containing protein [Desulfurivibrio sp.]
MEQLSRYPWPGNVRELENMVERMVTLAAGRELTVEDIPERLRQEAAVAPVAREPAESGAATSTSVPPPLPSAESSLSEMVAEFEKGLIIQAMEETGWVKNRAAKLLRVNRTTLLEKMKRYQLSGPEDVSNV